MSTINNLIIYILYFIIFSLNDCEDKIKEIQLEQEIKGKLDLDESHEYFYLKIPKGVNQKVLVFTINQQNEELKNDEDISFSDPDFYISKDHKYPSSRLSSNWYSQRYGADIITIPPQSVKTGDVFYIGVYCQFKCRYKFNSYVTEEVEIKEGIATLFNMKSKETQNLKLHMKDFDELKVIIYYRQKGKIRVFMSKHMPTTQNSFNVIPSWVYGYSIIIKKNMPEYCSHCDYHIYIKNEGKNTINDLFVYPIVQKKRFTLRNYYPLYDTMEKKTKRCYDFPISYLEKIHEKFILQITMYSGKIDILFEGWESKSINDIKEYKGEKIENMIDSKIFYFDKKVFDEYDNNLEKYKGKDSKFNFCIYSQLESSFIISSYFLNKLESFQDFKDINILLPGNLIKGYLLKNQVFKYDLIALNLDKMKYGIKTNITIKLKNIIGETNIYGYYCLNEKCIYKKDDLDKLIKDEKLIKSEEKNALNEYIIKIDNKNNFCYKKEIIEKEENIDNCFIIILLHCKETITDNNLCIYEIQMQIEDEPIIMNPRQTYYGVIPIKKEDSYEIIITDKNIYNLIIVLNTESGDAELKVSKEKKDGNMLSLASLHDDYIPDVIRITPKRINTENLIGKYYIKVFSKTFSTYQLYYYTTFIKEKNKNKEITLNKETTMNIKIGEIISEYFPMDIRYKIYTFAVLLNNKENIKIFMNKINIGFNIYIFKDLSNFNIVQIYDLFCNRNKEQISGYIWKSDSNNEINIYKNETEYNLNDNYYIIIAPDLEINVTKYTQNKEIVNNEFREFNFIETVARKTSIKFYLGISVSNIPLMIPEGIPHSMTLNNNYKSQLYYYEHFDLNKDFNLIINIIFGEIDIYIDINKISEEKIVALNDKNDYDVDLGFYQNKSLIYYKNIKSYYEMILDSYYFNKYIPEEEKSAKIYFYIKNSKLNIEDNKESQYSIIEKSSEKKEEILIPGETRTSNIPLGKNQYFIIEEVQKRTSGAINIFFKNGYGNIYVRIPKKPEVGKKKFPDANYYDYMGETIYSGRVVIIPKKEYDKLNYNNTKIQILITVIIDSGTYSNSTKDVTFSINYSNEPKTINQNDPYDGYIKKGELQYFYFYFDSNTENIYIGLSNMKGDADIFLNYGNILPTTKSYHWNSNQINHEFIDINKNDKFYLDHNITSMKGIYTLLVVGFIDTSYTLFISNHKDIIFPLRNNKKATCLCENIDDKCYFRFTDVFMIKNKENGINYNEIIFTLNYLYGNGIIYTKVVKDEEISRIKNMSQISQIFPNQDNYEISNKESKQRDYLKFKIKEEKYSEDSNILVTFICSEKTKVDISSTSIRYFKTTDFIEENKENIYYLGFDPNSDEFQSDITLFYYNYDKNKDLIYSIHSYVGDAHVVVYSNISWYVNEKQEYINEYKEIHSFDINSYNEQKSVLGSNPYNNDYHNVILVKEKEKYDNIIFKITPKNKFSFYIRCNYDKNFVEIPFGKMINYYAKNDEFYGYFDIEDEYSDIELAISLEKNLIMMAELYVKINILDISNINKNSTSNIYLYSIPSRENYDYKMETDKTLGTISLNMRNIPVLKPEEKNYKFIRGLFYIKINRKEFEPIPIEDIDIDINTKIKDLNKNLFEEKSLINILLTPGINNFKRVKANPYIYYFSNLTYENSTNERIPETKIWELRKDKIGHDVMIIEISSCGGEYSFKIQDHFISGVNNDVTLNYYEKKENGKHTIYINNLKSKIYYLSIEANEDDFICKMKNQGKSNINCGNDLSYIMYYYTDYEQSIKVPKVEKMLNYMPYGNGKIRIEIPEIIFRDINYNEREMSDFKFDVFATRKKEYFEKLGNVCFLSRFIPNEETIFYLEDMKLSKKKSLIISGLGYRNQYYIGILMQNAKTRELIAFNPIVIWSGGFLPYPIWEIVITFFIIIILIIALIIFGKQYKNMKNEIMEIKGDALPKNEFEVHRYGYSDHIKYSGIAQNYY